MLANPKYALKWKIIEHISIFILNTTEDLGVDNLLRQPIGESESFRGQDSFDTTGRLLQVERVVSVRVSFAHFYVQFVLCLAFATVCAWNPQIARSGVKYHFEML